MMRSLFTAIAGLRSQMTAMDVIGNNIANVNTLGFKKANVYFQDMFYQNLAAATAPTATRPGRNPVQVGLGSRVGAIDSIFTQGALENTGSPTDVSIEGKGFFMVGYGGATYYTRAGHFGFDANGYMVDSNGYILQGKKAVYDETTGEWRYDTSPIGDIQIAPNLQTGVKATDVVKLNVNLSGEAHGDTYEVWETGQFTTASGVATESATFTTAGSTLCSCEGVNPGDVIRIYGSLHDGTPIEYSVTIVSGSSPTSAMSTVATLGELISAVSTAFNGTSGTTENVQVTFEDGKIKVTDKTGGASQMSFGIDFVDADSSGSKFEVPTIWNSQEGVDADTHVVTTTIYDDKGTAHTLKITFTKVQGSDAEDDGTFFTSGSSSDNPNLDTGIWKWEATIDDGKIELDTGYKGRLTFDANGKPSLVYYAAHTDDKRGFADAIVSGCGSNFDYDIDGDGLINASSAATAAVSIETVDGLVYNPNPANGTAAQLTIKFDDIVGSIFTNYGGESRTMNVEQNGYPNGDLVSLAINEQGVISGEFSNGKSLPLYQIYIANFSNPQGLQKLGNNIFMETHNSGNRVVDAPGNQGLGTLRSYTVEMSNVDIAEEFTKMIVTQRGFEANSRVVTTSDAMLQEVLAMKR